METAQIHMLWDVSHNIMHFLHRFKAHLAQIERHKVACLPKIEAPQLQAGYRPARNYVFRHDSFFQSLLRRRF